MPSRHNVAVAQVVLALLMAVLGACQAGPSAALKEVLGAKVDAEWAAFKSKDAKAYGELLAEDFVAVEVDGEGTRTRDQAVRDGARGVAAEFMVKSRDLESIRLQARRMLSSPDGGHPRAPGDDRPAPSSRPGPPPSSRPAPSPSSRPGPPSSRSDAPPAAPLLDEVALASGLSKLVARSTIERACRRAGVDPARLTPRNLGGVLPSIETALRLFLPVEVVEARMAAIAKLSGA